MTWLRDRWLPVDAAVAAALLLPEAVMTVARVGPSGLMAFPIPFLVLLFPVLLTFPLVVRRRYPVACLVLVVAAGIAQWQVLPGGLLPITNLAVVPIAVHAAAAYGGRSAGWAGLAAGWTWALWGVIVRVLVVGPEISVGEQVYFGVGCTAGVLAGWATGTLYRVRQERMVTLIERARLLEIERDQAGRLAVAAERRRIAREMHDVVSHSLAVMIAQADGGWFAAPSSPQVARKSLATIGDAGRRAIMEMDRLLGVLRDDPDRLDDVTAEPDDLDAAPAGRIAAETPLPGVGDLAGLVDQARAGGLDVRIHWQPPGLLGGTVDSGTMDGGQVDGGVGLVIYRIVQEGLTNVMKHAGPGSQAEVVLRRSATGLEMEVEVLDDGAGVPGRVIGPVRSSGFGVVGMRERVAAYGGALSVGPRPGGGYAVRARIPVPS